MIIEINTKKDSAERIVRLIKRIARDYNIKSVEKWEMIAERVGPGRIQVTKKGDSKCIATAILT